MKKRHEIRCRGKNSRLAKRIPNGYFQHKRQCILFKRKIVVSNTKVVVKWKIREFVSPESIRFF